MDLKKIEKLVKIIEDSTLQEFSIKQDDCEIYMNRRGNEVVATQLAATVPNVIPPVAEEIDEDCYITSPIVGTFYSAQSPEAKAFVSVGDIVKAGQTVCILEAMKLMNEIESDFPCEIEAILVSNEQKVEYGQPLFKVKKLQA